MVFMIRTHSRMAVIAVAAALFFVWLPMKVYAGSSSESEHYYDWKQNDPRWSSITIGSKTMGENGSAVTSLAMLLVDSGLKNESDFNPGTFANDLKVVNGFIGDEIDWNAPTKIVSQFKYCGEITAGCHPGYGWNSLAEYYDQGYYMVVSRVNSEYWMAIKKVSTGYMSSTVKRSYASVLDPGTGNYTELDSEFGTLKVKLYTAPNPSYWKGDSPTYAPMLPSNIDSYKVPYSQALSVGSSGNEVKYLQYSLMCLGYAYNVPYGGEAADSSYGRITEMAVRNFQYNHGITVTGVCDLATWNAIERAVENIPGSCGENITFTLHEDGLLELNGSGPMYNYFYGDSSTPPQWYDNKNSIKSIVIKGEITTIGSYAFYNCSNLISITIPNSVTYIGSYAFSCCDSLKDIYYSGSESQWEKLKPDSFGLTKNVTVHFGETDIIPATGITLSKTSLNLKKGDSATLTATVTPSGSTDSVSWTSSNTSVATVSNGVVTAVGKGSATITATAGSKSAACTVNVKNKDENKLAIIQHPQNVKTLPGRVVTFSVKATGEGLSYQWYYKKANASDWSVWRIYTEPTINPPSNNTWDGMQVYCKVTDKKGKSVSSNPATVTILEPGASDFVIVSHPVSVTLNEGDTAVFGITAKGKGLTYQWYYADKGGSEWIKWKGHNKASTSTVVDKSWNGRQLYCVVTDNKGESLYSDIATVTIAKKLKISQQPINQTVKQGNSVTLSLKAEGTGLTYQWYFKKAGQTSFSKWKDRTHAKETVTPNASWNGIQLYCVVKDRFGKTVQSNTIKVTVTQTLKIITQPTNKTIKPGDSVTLSLKAEGTGLTYQWYFKKPGQTSFSKWNTRTHAKETVKPNATWNGIQLYCIVKDSSGKTVQSDTITVKIAQNLKITVQPTSKIYKPGDSVTLSLKAEGTGLTYQWYCKKAGQKSFNKWNGHTKASETFNPDKNWNGAEFYCKVKDSAGKTVKSSIVNLTVKKTEFKISQQPKSQTVSKGSSYTLSVKASGNDLSYQWYYKKKGAKSWTKWTNRTKSSVTFKPDEKWDGAQFYCKVKDSSGKTLNSSVAKLTVKNPD